MNELKSRFQKDVFDKVTRIEVITDEGRKYVQWDCSLQLSIQDDGKTLKVFVEEKYE